jgi:hypothetical protein
MHLRYAASAAGYRIQLTLRDTYGVLEQDPLRKRHPISGEPLPLRE